MSQSDPIIIRHLFISPGHNYFGHYGKPAGINPIHEVDEISCRAGYGIEGDRFYGSRPDYKGQITFFSHEVHMELYRALGKELGDEKAYRRNVITEGVDLNSLIGWQFTLGDVLFEGCEECRPCSWMNQAHGEGAEEFLKGNGGLRAKILEGGILGSGNVTLKRIQKVPIQEKGFADKKIT